MGYTTFPPTLYLELLYGFYNKRPLSSVQTQKHTALFLWIILREKKKPFVFSECMWADPWLLSPIWSRVWPPSTSRWDCSLSVNHRVPGELFYIIMPSSQSFTYAFYRLACIYHIHTCLLDHSSVPVFACWWHFYCQPKHFETAKMRKEKQLNIIVLCQSVMTKCYSASVQGCLLPHVC